MHKEAQPIVTLRKPDRRRQSRNQLKRSNNQPEYWSYKLSSVSSSLNTVRCNRLNGFLEIRSTVSVIDQSLQQKLRAQGTEVTLNINGIHGAKDLKTEKVPLKIKGLHSKVHSIEAFAHPSISLGNTNYNYNKLKQSFNHLSVLPNKSFNLMEVGMILG